MCNSHEKWFTCKCGCCVALSPPPSPPCHLPLKAIWTRPPHWLVPHDFPCCPINRSIYIAFHGWARSQYFKGPPVNLSLIIYCWLVHLILLTYASTLQRICTQPVFFLCVYVDRPKVWWCVVGGFSFVIDPAWWSGDRGEESSPV